MTPTLPAIPIPSPFGKISLPEYKLCFPTLPGFDDKSRRAMMHAIGIDISNILGWIPVIGDIVSDVVEDMHGAELINILSSDEYKEFLKQDKVAPSTIAMARTLTRCR
jgi:hypothetical protein